MRTRSKGLLPSSITRGDVWSYKYVGQQDTIVTSSYTYGGSHDYTVMTDDPHPGFFKRIKSGELILGVMTHIQSKRVASDGHSVSHESKPANVVYWNRTGNANWTAVMLAQDPPSYTLPELTGLKSDGQLYLDALANVDPTDFHLTEDILQIRQFLGDITKPLVAMRDVVRRVRSGGKWLNLPKSMGQVANTAANAWLNYRFVIVPTYNTVADIINGYMKHWKHIEKGVRLRASARTSDSATVSGNYWNGGHHEQYAVQHSLRTEKRAIAYYKLRSSNSGIAQTYGTRLKDLPVGMWNVITLSFMLDRILNISGYIQACANALDPNITFEGSCLVSRSSEEKDIRLFQQSYDTTYSVSTPPIHEETNSVIRTVGPSSALEIIDPTNLDFRPMDLVGSATRVLDLISLVYNAMRK